MVDITLINSLLVTSTSPVPFECSGNDTLLIVMFDGAGTPTVSYDGVPLTLLEDGNDIFYMWNPPNGTADIVLTLPNKASVALFGNVSKNTGFLSLGTSNAAGTGIMTMTPSGLLPKDWLVGIAHGSYGYIGLASGTLIKSDAGAQCWHISAYRLQTTGAETITIDGDDTKSCAFFGIRPGQMSRGTGIIEVEDVSMM